MNITLPTGDPERANSLQKGEKIERHDGKEREGAVVQDIFRISKSLWCGFKGLAHKHSPALGLVRPWPSVWKWRLELSKHMA